MKHPYNILVDNLSKYSTVLSAKDIFQTKPNVFAIDDIEFKIVDFLNDVQNETGIAPLEHSYIGASCSDPLNCFKPYKVFGFDNVLFYFKNKEKY